MRVRLLGSRICHKSHAIQFTICAPVLRTQKDLSCPAISQAKEVSYSLYIRFDCTQKIPSYTVGWLVGWLVGCKFYANYLYFCNHLPCLRTFPFQILHTYLTAIRGNCKVRFLDLMGKFLEGLGGFLGVSHSPINSIIFASGHKSFGKIDISSLCLRTIRTGVIVLS